MNVAESRDFKIGGRTYRDTLIGRDVHQISNPSTGHVYGEVVQIPADGRAKAYYLAGPGRERAETWEAAVQSARAQQPDPVGIKAPAPVVEPPAAPALKSFPFPVVDNAPEGWLPVAEAAKAYDTYGTMVLNRQRQGKIQGLRVRDPQARLGWRWVFAPPPPPAPLAPASPSESASAPRNSSDTAPEGWLPLTQAAPLYGLHFRTLRRYAQEGKVPSKLVKRNGDGHGLRYYVPPPSPAAVRVVAELPDPPPTRIVAAETAAPTVTIRPAGTKVRELETQLAELQGRVDAMEAATKRRSWLAHVFGLA